jgi:KaiC domain protein
VSGGEAEEEDWFEKALRESDDESEDTENTDTDSGATDTDSGSADADTESTGRSTESDAAGADGAELRAETEQPAADEQSEVEDSETPEEATGTDGDPFGGVQSGTDDPAQTETADDPFGGSANDDGATSESNSFGGSAGDGSTDDDGGDPFGSSGDESDPFGGANDDSPDESDPFGGANDDSPDGNDPFGGANDDSPDGNDPFSGANDDSPDEDDPFGGAQSSTGTDTEDPFGSTGGGMGAGDDGASSGEADPFGGAQTDDAGPDDNPFGEDFADAMGGGAGDMGGGFGGGGNDPAEFDDEDFESDIDRLDIGIEGLDDMILGGVPVRSLMSVIGSAGTGKTTFGLQFLNQAMENGGSGVYITLEETEEAIVSTAEEKGWPFGQYIEDDKLVVVSMDPIEMANSLDSIRGDISRLVNNFGADRLVLDSVSLLEMMYDHPAKRRSEVFDFARSLKGAGVTTMLTSEANADNSYQSRHGLVEYLVDAVFILQYVRPSDFQETRLAVEIQKIRDANHSRETKPYDITDDGISVYRQANIF